MKTKKVCILTVLYLLAQDQIGTACTLDLEDRMAEKGQKNDTTEVAAPMTGKLHTQLVTFGFCYVLSTGNKAEQCSQVVKGKKRERATQT